MTKNETTCNICGLPSRVYFTEMDEETGKRVKKSHIVKCIGHNVLPHQWNRDKNYHRWQRFLEKQKRSSGNGK